MSTTRSKILSLNEKQIQDLLSEFLDGLHSIEYLQDKLRGHITIQFASLEPQKRIQIHDLPENILIQVKPTHVQHILEQYLGNMIDLEHIHNWACFVFMMPCYIPEGENEDEQLVHGESDIWDVIQQIADPNNLSNLDILIKEDFRKRFSRLSDNH